MSDKYLAPGGWADVVSCSADNAPNMFYCGFNNEDRCIPGSAQDVFSLPNGYFADQRNVTLTATGRASSSAAVSPTVASLTVASLTLDTACPTAAAVHCSGDNSANTERLCPSHNRAEIGIGIGVGLPLACALGMVLFLLHREKRRGRQKLQEQQRGMHHCTLDH